MIYVSPPVALSPEDRWGGVSSGDRASRSLQPSDCAPISSFAMVDVIGNEVVADVPKNSAFDARAVLLGGRQKDGRWLFPAGKVLWVQTLCEQVFGHRGDNNASFLRQYAPFECQGGAMLIDAGLVIARITDTGDIELGAGMVLVHGSLVIRGEGKRRQIVAGEHGAIVESVISAAYSNFLAAKVVAANQQERSRRKTKTVSRKRRPKKRA